jgi:hypothetical protein
VNLLDYITGNRRGREAHRLEREAMSDPFLADALEGYDSVGGDPSGALERLRGRVVRRADSGRRRRIVRWVGVAAVLVLSLMVGYRFLFPEAMPEPIVPYLAESTEIEPPPPTDSAQREISTNELAQALPSEPAGKPEPEVEQLKATADILAIPNATPSLDTDLFFNDIQESSTIDFAFDSAQATSAAVSTGALQQSTTDLTRSAAPSSARRLKEENESAPVVPYIGRVVDAEGKPVAGALVMAYQGDGTSTQIGTITDMEGGFSLDVPQGAHARASFIGYETAIVRDLSPNSVIVLSAEKTELEEVVVVGYSTKKIISLTGSASVIDPSNRRSRNEFIPEGEPEEGMDHFREHVQTNRIPIYDSQNNRITGRVILEFRVNRRGRPVRIDVSQSLSPEADREARRLLENGPDWKPADTKVQVVIEFE